MKTVHPLLWLVESLQDNPTYVDRPMFGGRAIYYDGRMVLYLAMKAEPWRGVLVPAEREAHAALRAEFPALAPHPVLPKWLYLPENLPGFEGDAQRLVASIRALDPRIGVVPEAGRPKKVRAGGRPRVADRPGKAHSTGGKRAGAAHDRRGNPR